jgi:hypothetical protein
MGVTVTTNVASTYVPISTTKLNSDVNTVTLSSIPSTYTDLILVSNQALNSGPVNILVTVNGSTSTIYSGTYMGGDGSSAFTGRVQDGTGFNPSYLSTSINTTMHYFMNYSNTNIYKTILARSNTNNTNVLALVGTWRNTAAISSITLTANSGYNIVANSTFTLYGIKGA